MTGTIIIGNIIIIKVFTINIVLPFARVYQGITEVLEGAGVGWQQNLPVMMDFEVFLR